MDGLTGIWRDLRKNHLSIIGLVIIIIFIFLAVFGPYLAPYDPYKMSLRDRHNPPGGKNLLGTDYFGRDVLSRIIYGARISMIIGISVVLLQMLIGIPIGLISGYYRGIVDSIFMRIADTFISFPSLLLALAIMAIYGRGMVNIIISLTVVGWTRFARLIRAEVIGLREAEFVQASRALGKKDLGIMFKTVLPNCLAPIIVYGTMQVAQPILMEAALSFLGLGLPNTTPSWGMMLNIARQYISRAWWSATFPGLAIMLLVLGFNFFGDGLRDALDPRLKNIS